MSNVTRRDFLKTSATLGIGFVSIGGVLVPRTSSAASPVIGIVLTSLLQVLATYLTYRNQHRLSSLKSQYNPYDYTVSNYMNMGLLSGNLSQKSLYSGNTNAPINNFQDVFDGQTLTLQKGSAHMSNGYQGGRYDPAELKIAEQYERKTGYGLFPVENQNTGFYNIPTKNQVGLLKEAIQDDPNLSKLGELGENQFVQGTRRFVDDKGNEVLMSKLSTRGSKILNTFAVVEEA